MDEIRNQIYLGALLHDIGKFYQKADENYYERSQLLNDNSKEIVGYICPQNEKGNFGFHHVIWTLDFFNKNEKLFKQLNLIPNVYDEKQDMEHHTLNFAIYHHKPNNELQSLVQLADWWSSAMDRTKKYEEFTTTDYKNFKDVRLL